jgi:hypothetical protein
MVALTAHQVRQVAVEALASDRTVRKVYSGGATKNIVLERIRRAAARLGLPLPPSAADDVSEPTAA